jgi:hypothetical protein
MREPKLPTTKSRHDKLVAYYWKLRKKKKLGVTLYHTDYCEAATADEYGYTISTVKQIIYNS